MTKKIILLVLFILPLIHFSAFSENVFPEKLNPPRIVNDYTNFLSQKENAYLENKLVKFNNETSTQIAIVIVKSLNGYDKSDYAARLGEKWGVGQKGSNNGLLILIKPKYAREKGEVFIATGYGLEGAVPDAVAKRIVEREIIPNFKNGLYFKGLNSAVDRIIELTKGEYTSNEYMKKNTEGAGSVIGFFMLFFIIIIFSIIGKFRRARHYSLGHNIPLWTALWLASSSSHSSGSSWNSFSSGSGSFGGGFGGFGGGGFGGGGAGGSW